MCGVPAWLPYCGSTQPHNPTFFPAPSLSGDEFRPMLRKILQGKASVQRAVQELLLLRAAVKEQRTSSLAGAASSAGAGAASGSLLTGGGGGGQVCAN